MKLIKTEQYLLWIDEQNLYLKDEELILREWYPSTQGFTREIIKYKSGMQSLSEKRIIAHLPLNSSPILEGVSLLPELVKSNPLDRRKPIYMVQNLKAGKEGNLTIDVQLFEDLEEAKEWCGGREHLNIQTQWVVAKELPKQEEDVEKLAHQQSIEVIGNDTDQQYFLAKNMFKLGYGIKAASKKKWSDEDMINFARKIKDNPIPEAVSSYHAWYKSQLPSPTSFPIGFEPEYEASVDGYNWFDFKSNPLAVIQETRLKVVNGVLQGRWIW